MTAPRPEVPVAVTVEENVFDDVVQFPLALPCPSNVSKPKMSKAPLIAVPESELPVPLKGHEPDRVLTAQAAGWRLPVPL